MPYCVNAHLLSPIIGSYHDMCCHTACESLRKKYSFAPTAKIENRSDKGDSLATFFLAALFSSAQLFSDLYLIVESTYKRITLAEYLI